MTKTFFQIYKRSSPILSKSVSLRVPKFPSVLNELRIIPTSSFGTYTSFEVKGRFINPRSLLRHLNNQSHKVNTHVYKR